VLLRDDERDPVERARRDEPMAGWGERVERQLLLRNAEGMATRTVAIDDAVRERVNPQLVVLGAGLDGRAWRMPELADTEVFEVDHPASQRDKRDRARPLQALAGALRFVPVDFARERLADGLLAAGHQATVPTTWIWEGVLAYLTVDEVTATLRALRQRSAPGSRVVVNYHSFRGPAALGRRTARALLARSGRGDPMANEPLRSRWDRESISGLLVRHDLRIVRNVGMAEVAEAIPVPVRNSRFGGSAGLAVADC
jgi:methyltransferase (TIGR00027 family)